MLVSINFKSPGNRYLPNKDITNKTISEEQVLKIAEPLSKNGYGQYLIDLIKEK